MSDDSSGITRLAPAKVNLTLAVLGRRDDGFHEIESWMVPVAWHDRVTVRPAQSFSFRLRGNVKAVPSDESNLACRAARLIAAEAGRPVDCEIELEKFIPPGGGLGGGSSDAAALLLALNELWGLKWPRHRLAGLGAKIGSDVPFFIFEQAAIVRGRGEAVEPCRSPRDLWLALIVPPFAVSTRAVYERLAEDRRDPGGARRERPTRPWEREITDTAELGEMLFNDLESAAFTVQPQLAALHAAVDGLHERRVRMTGSGACLFTVLEDRAAAEQWERAARGALANQAVTRIVTTSAK